MSLRRQIWVVLLSYLTRTGFRWAIISGLSGFSLMLIGAGCGKIVEVHHGDLNPFAFLIAIGIMIISGSVVAALILFVVHARNQLMGHVTRIVPNTRTANLIVAVGILVAIVAATMTPMWDDTDFSKPVVFLLLLGLVTLIAWAVCNPWLTPVPVAVLWIVNHSEAAQLCLFNIVRQHDWAVLLSPNPTDTELWKQTWRLDFALQTRQLQLSLRVTLVLANILALLVLERLCRPRKASVSPIRFISQIAKFWPQTPIAPTQQRHPFIESHFARSLHRRFAIHNWRAAFSLAGMMALLTAMLCYNAGLSDETVSIVGMLTIPPGALAAIGWRNRWGSYEYETLYPVRHPQFVNELMITLLLDMLEYWLACLVAVVLTVLVMRPQMLRHSLMWTAISGSAMMQLLWIGAIPLAGQRRQTVRYFAGLGIVVIANVLAFDDLRRADSMHQSHFLIFAGIQMFAGVLFFAGAAHIWRRQSGAAN